MKSESRTLNPSSLDSLELECSATLFKRKTHGLVTFNFEIDCCRDLDNSEVRLAGRSNIELSLSSNLSHQLAILEGERDVANAVMSILANIAL